MARIAFIVTLSSRPRLPLLPASRRDPTKISPLRQQRPPVRLAALKAKRHGDRYAGFKAIVELAAKVLRIVWGVWRSGTPYDPLRTGGLQRQPR